MGFWALIYPRLFNPPRGGFQPRSGVEVSRLQSYTSVPGLRDDDGGLKASEARPVGLLFLFLNVSES